jgi:hypothetical protein
MKRNSGNTDLSERRTTLEALLAALDDPMQKITRAIATGVIELEDDRDQTEPLRKRGAELREELAGLPEPQRIPTIDEIDTGAFWDDILRNWQANEQAVQRKGHSGAIMDSRHFGASRWRDPFPRSCTNSSSLRSNGIQTG